MLKTESRSLVPTGKQYLIFHLSGEARYKGRKGQLFCKDNVALIHIHDFCYSAEFSSDFHALGIAMKPNALYQLFGKEFGKNNFFMSDSQEFLEHEELKNLCQVLKKQKDVSVQINFLEKYLITKMEPYEPGDIVDLFLNYMGNFEKEISTSEIAAQLCTNQRSLELNFLKITGTTPGKYKKLMRFVNLFRDFSTEGYSISELIKKYNYIDYSHLSRDFKKHTGASLRESNIPPDSMYNAYLSANGLIPLKKE